MAENGARSADTGDEEEKYNYYECKYAKVDRILFHVLILLFCVWYTYIPKYISIMRCQ